MISGIAGLYIAADIAMVALGLAYVGGSSFGGSVRGGVGSAGVSPESARPDTGQIWPTVPAGTGPAYSCPRPAQLVLSPRFSAPPSSPRVPGPRHHLRAARAFHQCSAGASAMRCQRGCMRRASVAGPRPWSTSRTSCGARGGRRGPWSGGGPRTAWSRSPQAPRSARARARRPQVS